MVRPVRIDVEGGWYHVMGRGLDGMTLFEDERENGHFLELLEKMVKRYGVEIHAYALMGNHYHLLIRTPAANASPALQWLNVSYGIWYNKRRQRSGPVFQGRFKSVLIEGLGSWLLDASVYVHLNPVRIAELELNKIQNRAEAAGLSKPARGMVLARLKTLRSYPWNSFRAYAGYTKVPEWLSMDELLKRGGGRVEYRKYVQGYVTRGQDIEDIHERILLGTEVFRETARKLVGALGSEQPDRKQLEARVPLERIKKVVEGEWGEPWDSFVDRHGDLGRNLAIYLAREYSGLTLAQIGMGLGGVSGRSAGQAVLAIERRMSDDADLERSVRRCKRQLYLLET